MRHQVLALQPIWVIAPGASRGGSALVGIVLGIRIEGIRLRRKVSAGDIGWHVHGGVIQITRKRNRRAVSLRGSLRKVRCGMMIAVIAVAKVSDVVLRVDGAAWKADIIAVSVLTSVDFV